MDPIFLNAGWFVPIGQQFVNNPPPNQPPPSAGIIGGGCSRIEYALPGENCLQIAERIGVTALEMFGANPSICDIANPAAAVIPLVNDPAFVYPNITVCVI